jgi:hypothetical protein
MNPTEVNRFNELYQRHLRLLKLQGKSQKTIDAYSRAVRRVSEHFDCCPDQLTPEQLEILSRMGLTGATFTTLDVNIGNEWNSSASGKQFSHPGPSVNYYHFFREVLFSLKKGCCCFLLLHDERNPAFFESFQKR